MADFITNSELTRGPAAELWRKTLARVPTNFGRLVFLASLRDNLTGRYSHPPLSQMVGREITDRTLCHSHHEIFAQWLGFTLAQQQADLDEYLTTAYAVPDLAHFREIVPGTAHQVERQLYLTDLETLLELRRFGHDGACPVPEEA